MEREIARSLYRSVVASSVQLTDVDEGDLIVVTGATDDTVGVVDQVFPDAISLITKAGVQKIKSSQASFIHIIRKANMDLNLRNHTEYERDLKDMTKETHGYKDGGAKRPEHGPVTDSEKSALPTSKVSALSRLNLRKRS